MMNKFLFKFNSFHFVCIRDILLIALPYSMNGYCTDQSLSKDLSIIIFIAGCTYKLPHYLFSLVI